MNGFNEVGQGHFGLGVVHDRLLAHYHVVVPSTLLPHCTATSRCVGPGLWLVFADFNLTSWYVGFPAARNTAATSSVFSRRSPGLPSCSVPLVPSSSMP